MQVILGILGFIFIFGLAVLVHELGHFLTARKFGVLCHEFAIGMGPIIWKRRTGETLYTIRAIPIGGFVSMGMNEGERDILKEGSEIGITFDSKRQHVTEIFPQADEGQVMGTLLCNTIDVSTNLEIALEVEGERRVYSVDREAMYIDTEKDRRQQIVPTDRRLESKPKRQRFTIMVAGAIMNFILAYVLVLIVAAISGEVVGHTTELNGVVYGAPAYESGMRAGDVILGVNGVAMIDEEHVISEIQLGGADGSLFEFEREGMIHEALVIPIHQQGSYRIGIEFIPITEHSFMGIFRSANARWSSGAMLIVDSLRMLATREAGVDQLAGLPGIIHMTSEVAVLGIVPFLMFASIININLGIFNLLPFPGLDGGHVTFIAIESIIGKPVNEKIQYIVSMIGIMLLLALMVFTFYNDIRRIFFG